MDEGLVKNQLWQTVLGEIELSVSKASFLTWFKNTKLLSLDEDCVVIGAHSVFIKDQLEKKFNELIVTALKNNGVNPASIEYRTHALNNKPVIDEPVIVLDSGKASVNVSDAANVNYGKGLNDRYSFDNFIVGSSNELAYAACQAVAAEVGTKYNPLFLYGGVGIGKTHLIQAVGNSVLQKNPKAKVVYVSSEQFLKEFVEALRFKKSNYFSEFYRTADVLIVDDVQFIAGKEKVQEEFFHTFNTLYQANKQVVISSDRQPRDILTIEERLRSRLAQGMAIDMQIPDFETRCAIIQDKAHKHGFTLPTDVTEFLSTNIKTNIRELEGALNQLLAFCEMRNLKPDIQIATSLLSSIKSRPKHINPRQVVERTAKHFQIPLNDILGSKRDKDIVTPRQVAMYILRSELHLSFPKIAQELGRKDHTTAMHSVEKITKESALDASIRAAINEIKERLYA